MYVWPFVLCMSMLACFSVCLSACLRAACVFACLSVQQSVCLSVCLVVYLSVYLSVWMSVLLSVSLCVCMFVQLQLVASAANLLCQVSTLANASMHHVRSHSAALSKYLYYRQQAHVVSRQRCKAQAEHAKREKEDLLLLRIIVTICAQHIRLDVERTDVRYDIYFISEW